MIFSNPLNVSEPSPLEVPASKSIVTAFAAFAYVKVSFPAPPMKLFAYTFPWAVSFPAPSWIFSIPTIVSVPAPVA